ncbi:hypothetical protein IO90_08460 [Chryseobacterium sp. FH1]|nr:hypothetical protein IO90_08460 [Chryseobacterium sp. FH1]
MTPGREKPPHLLALAPLQRRGMGFFCIGYILQKPSKYAEDRSTASGVANRYIRKILPPTLKGGIFPVGLKL